MENHKPLPKDYVNRYYKKPTRDTSPEKPRQEDTPELFGPKEFKND
jgi:hypothetical protein